MSKMTLWIYWSVLLAILWASSRLCASQPSSFQASKPLAYDWPRRRSRNVNNSNVWTVVKLCRVELFNTPLRLPERSPRRITNTLDNEYWVHGTIDPMVATASVLLTFAKEAFVAGALHPSFDAMSVLQVVSPLAPVPSSHY